MSSKSLQNILIELEALQADKLHFRLLNGLVCEGWITAVEGENFRFLSSGPLAQEEELLFEIAQLDFASISYYDKEARKWMEFLK
ncbi:MAG: hypothetical protein H6579_07920 [Chitinophagales bacterium]|nr:hypothetical protein [Chitinophagales bacterium]